MPKTQKRTKTPQLRFPEFSGEWDGRKLKEVADFWNGKAHEKDISKDGEYVVINSKFVSSGGEVKKYSDKQMAPLKNGDIAIVMSDIPNGQALAKCFFVDEDDKYTLNQRIGGIRGKEVISQFLFRVLNRNKYFLKFDNKVSQTNLRKKEVLSFPVRFPPLPEQQKIASFLTKVDEWIDNLKQQKEKLEEYKKGIMQKIFPAKGEKVPKFRFPEFSGDWEEKKLGEVGDINTGTTPPTSNSDYYNGKYPWITPTDIEENKDIYDSERQLSGDGMKVGRRLSKDTLLVTCIASIGKNAILRVEGSCNQQINAITPSKNNNVDFLYYLIEESTKTLLRYASSGGMKILNKTDFSKIKLEFPPLPEQQKIADFLTSVDEAIELKQEQISQAETWKKGLIQKMFV